MYIYYHIYGDINTYNKEATMKSNILKPKYCRNLMKLNHL